MIEPTPSGRVLHDSRRRRRVTALDLQSRKLQGKLSPSKTHLEGKFQPASAIVQNSRVIHLNFNKLTGRIPEELSNLPKVIALHIAANNLTGGITPFLGNLSTLLNLSLARNNLGGSIPDDLGRLASLNFLQAGSNNLSGIIPASILNLSVISIFAAADNKLTGSFPQSLGTNFPNLQIFAVGVNRFTGPIPPTLSNATGLLQIDFPDNYFVGRMPTDLGSIKNLQRLNVGRNRLGSREADDLSFLNSLINCSKLQLLGNNQIYGSIHSGIENLVKLHSLYIDHNMISGGIPIEIGKLSSLRQLYMNGNRLSRNIPHSIGNMTELFELRLDGNNLEGTIPSTLWNCVHLQVLNLSQNNLKGTIPKEVIGLSSLSKSHTWQLPKLGASFYEGNLFEGTIPGSLSSLKGLQDLDLSRNNLSGQILEFLQGFIFLQYLNLSFNNFEGEVPRQGVFTNISSSSLLGNSKPCGGIFSLQLPPCPKQKKKPSPTSHSDDWHSDITYKDLHKATDGFSPANLIGVGSFGSVFKGMLNDGRTIAVKVPNLQQKGAIKVYIAECSCSSVDFRGNNLQFIPNGSLGNWLHLKTNEHHRQLKLNIFQRLNIAIDVASAPEYLHHHCHTPIIHCDLKPSNVLLDADFCAHVSDSGLAKFLTQCTDTYSQNQTSSIGERGSIGYIAPEYAVGGAVSTYGDVYSYGILLLEMFTGRRPTDDIFKDGSNLHNFAKKAIPEQVMEILDPTMLLCLFS
ncbi:PREDICTED: probable LRR receptor-like serine/threonine-protein kinase At3g47570 [Theobroma cacao]|uniref:non-specific serine/threonine protein kinase n=1 Tax=Theobroma cacao TaxID=3641 RepID=A0AB32X1J1_THECC|nr:PREDICTED: probable LRR receptor-like serine/threonine-protein kinase At3g47570 [Theobroma cacao]